MALTFESLLTFFPLNDVPACADGLQLAGCYLSCCLNAVSSIATGTAGVNHDESLKRWEAFHGHYVACEQCRRSY